MCRGKFRHAVGVRFTLISSLHHQKVSISINAATSNGASGTAETPLLITHFVFKWYIYIFSVNICVSTSLKLKNVLENMHLTRSTAKIDRRARRNRATQNNCKNHMAWWQQRVTDCLAVCLVTVSLRGDVSTATCRSSIRVLAPL